MGAGQSLTPLENTLQGFASALFAADRERAELILHQTFRKLTKQSTSGVVDTVSAKQVTGNNISEAESRVAMVMSEVYAADKSTGKTKSRRNFESLLQSLGGSKSVHVNLAVIGNTPWLDRLKATRRVRYNNNVVVEQKSEEEVAAEEEVRKREAQERRKREIWGVKEPIAWHTIECPPRLGHGNAVANCLFVDENTKFSEELLQFVARLDAVVIGFEDEIVAGAPRPPPPKQQPGLPPRRPRTPPPAPAPASDDARVHSAFQAAIGTILATAPSLNSIVLCSSSTAEASDQPTLPEDKTKGKFSKRAPLTIHDPHPRFEGASMTKLIREWIFKRWGSDAMIIDQPRATKPDANAEPSGYSPDTQQGGDGVESAHSSAPSDQLSEFEIADVVATVLTRPTLLHQAVKTGCRFFTEAAASTPSSVGYAMRQDGNGRTALHLAVAAKDFDLVQVLFRADPAHEHAICAPDRFGVTPLDLANHGKQSKMLKFLKNRLAGKPLQQPLPAECNALVFKYRPPRKVVPDVPALGSIADTPNATTGPPPKLAATVQRFKNSFTNHKARTCLLLENVIRTSVNQSWSDSQERKQHIEGDTTVDDGSGGGFLITEVPEEAQPPTKQEPVLRSLEVDVTVKGPNVQGNRELNVGDFLYVTDPANNNVVQTSNFIAPEESVNAASAEASQNDEISKAASVEEASSTVSATSGSETDIERVHFSLGVSHAFLDYQPKSEEILAVATGKNLDTVVWNHVGDRVVRVNGKSQFYADEFQSYPLTLTCKVRASPNEEQLILDAEECFRANPKATLMSLKSLLLGVNPICELPCGHWCEKAAAWSASCVVGSENRYDVATSELKLGQLAAGTGHNRCQAQQHRRLAWKWLTGALVQVEKGDLRYSLPAQELLKKGCMWACPSSLSEDWRLLRCLASARLRSVYRLFEYGIYEHREMYKHPLSAHNEAAGSLVKGSGYESSDPFKDCVRESKTAADPLQEQACVNGLDLRHDRSDLVPPPGSWGFPSWRHGEAKKKAVTLLQRAARVWAAQRFLRIVRESLVEEQVVTKSNEALKRTQARASARRIQQAKDYEHKVALETAQKAVTTVTNDDKYSGLLFLLGKVFAAKFERALADIVGKCDGQVVRCRVKPIENVVQDACGPMPTAAGGNLDLIEAVVEFGTLESLSEALTVLERELGGPQAISNSFAKNAVVYEAHRGIRSVRLLQRVLLESARTWADVFSGLSKSQEDDISAELLACHVVPQDKPKLTTPAQDALIEAERKNATTRSKSARSPSRGRRSKPATPTANASEGEKSTEEDPEAVLSQYATLYQSATEEKEIFSDEAVSDIWDVARGLAQQPAAMLCSIVFTVSGYGRVATRCRLWEHILKCKCPREVVTEGNVSTK